MFKSNNRTILQPGKICTFDPLNVFKQSDSGVLHVRLIKRIKFRLFGKSIWKVCPYLDINDNESFNCPEFLLYPEGMAVVRYPADSPTFNEHDLQTLEIIIKNFDRAYNGSSSPNNDLSNYVRSVTPKDIDRLKAITEKIALSIKMKEV